MSNFNIFQPSSEALYWKELYEFAKPYAIVATTLTKAIAFLTDIDLNDGDFFANIRNCRPQIQDIKNFVGNLKDVAIKDRSLELLTFIESLEEYEGHREEDILAHVLEASLDTKEKLIPYLGTNQPPVEYYHSYNVLNMALFPLRASALLLKNIHAINQAKDERDDMVANQIRGTEVAKTIGHNRVSPIHKQVVLSDEAGPTWETDYWILVDDQGVYAETGNTAAIRQRLRLERDRLLIVNADIVAKDIKDCYDAASNMVF